MPTCPVPGHLWPAHLEAQWRLDWAGKVRRQGFFLLILFLSVVHGPASEGATAVCDCGMEEGLGEKEGDGGRMGVTGQGNGVQYVCLVQQPPTLCLS